MLALREELRTAKPKLLDGAKVEEAVMAPLREREDELARKKASGTAVQALIRAESLFVRKMRDIAGACTAAGVEAGSPRVRGHQRHVPQ